MALAYLGPGLDQRLERRQIGLRLAVKPDIGEHGHPEAERLRVDLRVVTENAARPFQRAHAAETGRRRYAGAARELDIGHASAVLEVAEDTKVDPVELDPGHG